MATPVFLAYYYNLVLSHQAPELTWHIAVSEFCICVLVSSFLSALVGGPVGFKDDFTGAEDVSAPPVLLPLPVGVHNFVQSFGLFRIISHCTVNLLKAYLPYSWSLEVCWTADGCIS